MRRTGRFLTNLAKSMTLTVAFTFGLYILNAIFRFALSIDEHLVNVLAVAVLNAILVTHVYAEYWYEAKLRPRAAVAIYLIHYLVSCVAASVYFALLHRG